MDYIKTMFREKMVRQSEALALLMTHHKWVSYGKSVLPRVRDSEKQLVVKNNQFIKLLVQQVIAFANNGISLKDEHSTNVEVI